MLNTVYGLNQEAAAQRTEELFKSLDVDHKLDLQVSGALANPNDISNLGMLDSSVNRSLGRQLQFEIQRLGLKTGDAIDAINVIGPPER